MPYQFSGRRSGVAFGVGCNFLAFLRLFWSHTTGSRYDIYGRRCSLRCYVFVSRRVVDWNMLLMKEIHPAPPGMYKTLYMGYLLRHISTGQPDFCHKMHGFICGIYTSSMEHFVNCQAATSKLHAWNEVETWIHRSIALFWMNVLKLLWKKSSTTTSDV